MRVLPVLLLSTTLLSPAAYAADITYDGAKQVEDTLNRSLPTTIAKTGIIKVRPGTTDYDVTVDLPSLLKQFAPASLTVTGLEPFLYLIHPQDDGSWSVSHKGGLDIQASATENGKDTHFSYKADTLDVNGIYEPDLLLPRSADAATSNVHMAMQSPEQDLDASIGAIMVNVTGDMAGKDKISYHMTGKASDFSETVTAANAPKFTFSYKGQTDDMSMNGLAYASLRDLVDFVLKHKDQKHLGKANQKELKERVRNTLPLYDDITGSTEMTGLKVSTDMGDFSAESLHYSVSSNGLSDKAKFSVGLQLSNPSAPAGLLPEAFEAAMPETIAAKLSVEDIDLSGGISAFMEHADFDAPEPITDAEAAKLPDIFFPGGALTLRYDDVSAKSAVYDFSLSGISDIDVRQKGRETTDAILYARDFDKTIAYLQDNAKTVPQFGQAAFVALMMKGFAKTAPDGRQMWHVTVDEDKKVTINGQPFPMGKN